MRERTKMGPLQLKQIDDEVYIKIKNTGTKDFFYNIIEMSADGSISPVFPNANLVDPVTHLPKPSMPEELILEADSTKILKQWKLAFDCPCGEETFKVFLSTQPLDLEALLTTKSGARSVLSDLERVFKNSKPDNTGKRGGSGTINTSDNGTIFGLNFRVVPR